MSVLGVGDPHLDSSGKSPGPFGWEQGCSKCCQRPGTKFRADCWLPSCCCESLASVHVSVFHSGVEDMET